MRFWTDRGRILKLRTGHLANFSGGAGYMPFIVILSVPASILFGFIGSLFLTSRGRRLLGADNGGAKTGLYEFVKYAHRHTMVCLSIAVVAGISLFCFASTMVYGDKMKYVMITAIFAIGPIAAWALSMIVLARLMARRGVKWTNLLIAAVIHILLLAACIPLILLASAITGARL
jgi:hypothetical protein